VLHGIDIGAAHCYLQKKEGDGRDDCRKDDFVAQERFEESVNRDLTI
jgi:hypothetical protein